MSTFSSFFCHFYRTTASLSLELLLSWQRDITTSPLYIYVYCRYQGKMQNILLNPLTIDLRVSGAPFTVTIYSLVDEPGFCNDTIADILLSALEK